ncbi:hypothetical protein BpHYR1_004409, partial [Brachionus plicatilis]
MGSVRLKGIIYTKGSSASANQKEVQGSSGNIPMAEKTSVMTLETENLRGGCKQKSGIFTAKHRCRVGTWNVRTMSETSRCAQAALVMEKYGLEVL